MQRIDSKQINGICLTFCPPRLTKTTVARNQDNSGAVYPASDGGQGGSMCPPPMKPVAVPPQDNDVAWAVGRWALNIEEGYYVEKARQPIWGQGLLHVDYFL